MSLIVPATTGILAALAAGDVDADAGRRTAALVRTSILSGDWAWVRLHEGTGRLYQGLATWVEASPNLDALRERLDAWQRAWDALWPHDFRSPHFLSLFHEPMPGRDQRHVPYGFIEYEGGAPLSLPCASNRRFRPKETARGVGCLPLILAQQSGDLWSWSALDPDMERFRVLFRKLPIPERGPIFRIQTGTFDSKEKRIVELE